KLLASRVSRQAIPGDRFQHFSPLGPDLPSISRDPRRIPGRQPGSERRCPPYPKATLDLEVITMAGIMRIRRTHGILGGVLVALLGIWGALIPFVGPYFHSAYAP